LAIENVKPWLRVEALLSVAMHFVLLGMCVWYFRNPLTTNIVAAGEGQGTGDSLIEVGTVDGRALGFTLPRAVSFVGEEKNTANNEVVETEAPKPEPNAEVLPTTKSTPTPKEKLTTTNRPTANQTSQIVSPTPLRGASTNTNIEVGRSFGSQVPSMTAGGGSEYGRRIQMILSRNYNPPAPNDASGTQYVIVQLRIARDGRILSLVNGRVAPNYFKKRSPNDLINYAAERAVIASNQLPPFPNGFLMGAQEGVAEIWFKYPK
jgi:TonB C terminal